MTALPPRIATHYPWTGTRIPLSGGAHQHVLDVGQGDPLLFVHGNPTWSFAWRTLVGPLSSSYRCVAPDHLGCGLSDAQPRPLRLADHVANLVEVIDHLDLRRATLVVHDWGGPIGMLAAMARPERFERLVVFNTALFHGPVPAEIRMCRWPVWGPFVVERLNGFVLAGMYRALHDWRRWQDGVGDGYLFPWNDVARRTAVMNFVADIPLEADHPTRPVLDGLDRGWPAFAASRPTLAIWGMRDFCFTPAFLGEIRKRAPHAEVHELPDAAHYVVEDAHEQIVPKLRAFLDAHPLAPATP